MNNFDAGTDIEPDLVSPLKQKGKSDVWLCNWKGDKAVAKFGPSVIHEARILKKGQPYLPRLLAIQKNKDPMQSFIIREFIPGISLADCRSRVIDFMLILKRIAQLMLSLQDPKPDLPFIHGDISPDNIIVNNNDISLVDFENSGWGICVQTRGIKPMFAAPEVIASKECTVVGDIFSIGRTLQYCKSGIPADLLAQMVNKNPQARPQSWDEVIKITAL